MRGFEWLDKINLPPQLGILALLTLLSLLPAVILTTTSFTRFVVVFSFLRQGLGTQQTPPNQVIIGLSLFLTAFTMSPIVDRMTTEAYEPLQRQEITQAEALDRAVAPLRSFMLRQTREADLALFYEASGKPLPKTEEEVPLTIAAPAFMVSELTTAFEMGVLILLPFLVIDLAVASGLMSMGMMMVPPANISLPLKLMVFVLVDGWTLLVGSLLRSFS
ncbi:MAG: flagellar type III secretion system pore protein FliP [Myxococcales bacterium]|nr:flagellar type III secretion system pore protein FliP [Myxococcales bacterium]